MYLRVYMFCMGWSWYLPNDMQFYVVAPIIIVPMALGYNFVGLLMAFLQIALHVIMFTYLEEKYDATLTKNSLDYFIYIYIKPYARCGPYAIGLILGYAIFKTKFKAKLNKFVVALGWILAVGAGITLVFVTHDNYKDYGLISPEWSTDASNAYEIVVRPLWAVCVAWMIFACSNGYGGVINSILSWTAWIPLSRLTYGVYLFHVMVIHYFNNNRRALAYFTKEFVIERYLATFLLSYGMAFVASLLIETPIRNLTKPSSGGSSSRSSQNQTPETNGRQRPVLPASALSDGGKSSRHGKMVSKKVTFENEPPRFESSNPYSSTSTMTRSARLTPTTPTAPFMHADEVNTVNQQFGVTPAAPIQLLQVDGVSNDTSPAPVLADAPISSPASSEDVRVDLLDRTPQETSNHDNNPYDNENNVRISGSAGYPNLAYVTGNDESDWLSAALADGNNAQRSSM